LTLIFPQNQVYGNFIAYEFKGTAAHERCSSLVLYLIQVETTLSMRELSSLHSFGSVTCTIGNSLKEPDGGFLPQKSLFNHPFLENGQRMPFPNVVWEVANSHESLQVLHDELDLWLSIYTTVQVAIGIKLFRPCVEGTWRMIALLRQRHDHPVDIEFGSNIQGQLPNLVFPFAALYANTKHNLLEPNVLALINANYQISIDLAIFRQKILGDE
jgi:hypothetical protein